MADGAGVNPLKDENVGQAGKPAPRVIFEVEKELGALARVGKSAFPALLLPG